MKYIILILIIYVARPVFSEENAELEEFIQSLWDSLDEISSQVQLPEDATLNISEYLSKYNYPFESHEVTTEDGYILNLHRIPAESDNTSAVIKPAALLVPGLFCSGVDWVTLGPNSSLALLMSDQGYDIWLLNPRGSRYSASHQTLTTKDAAFWDYSFHEKGYYDVAASVDYIIASTSLQKITLVGHSEGTSDIMVLTSSRPEYNDKIDLMVLLSPIGYMGGVKSPIPLLLAHFLTELQAIVKKLGFYGFSYSDFISKAAVSICSTDQFETCKNLVQLLCGFDAAQLDTDYFTVLLSDKPNGISVKQLVHYGQEILTDTFRQYDYGAIENHARYGSIIPPAYDVSKMTAPVAAYFAKNDFFAAVKDVAYLLDEVPNKIDVYLIEDEHFNHLDFISATDAKTLLYDRVLSVIEKYNPGLV